MTLADSPAWIALTRGTIEARSRSYTPVVRTEPITREVAVALLTTEVQRVIAAGGRVEYATDTTAVLTFAGRTRPNHVLHLLLSVFTFGAWLLVWVVLTFAMAIDRPSRVMLTVDPYGNITRTSV